MTKPMQPGIVKWPFVVGDAILLGLIAVLFRQTKLPLDHQSLLIFAGLCALGALVLMLPAILEYLALTRLSHSEALTSAVDPLRNLEQLTAQIALATSQWQGVHEHSGKTVAAAREISERMTAEATSFREFLQKANDSEKSQLRFEIEKIKRAETDWLKVLVNILDHVYALNVAALKSGQPGVIEQLGNFQNACREHARRVGLNPLVPESNAAFDPQIHQLADAKQAVAPGATVAETMASGYVFRGQLLRQAVVLLQASAIEDQETAELADLAGG